MAGYDVVYRHFGGDSTLHKAVRIGHESIIAFLVRSGADLSLKDPLKAGLL